MAALVLIVASPCWSVEPTVTSAGTLILNSTMSRLDGVDAPTPDQGCLDEKGAVWVAGLRPAINERSSASGTSNVKAKGSIWAGAASQHAVSGSRRH